MRAGDRNQRFDFNGGIMHHEQPGDNASSGVADENGRFVSDFAVVLQQRKISKYWIAS